ncbi:hypothetical protein N9C84_03875 [Desulfobacterales bacterium]|nr:hypothetical protein [Desulfobacterales bacterium]
MKNVLTLLSIILSLSLISSCNTASTEGEKDMRFQSVKDVPESAWKKLADKKIYFGHQSVGNNIMDGVEEIMKEYPQIQLKIDKTVDIPDFKKANFIHNPNLGKNKYPDLKIDAFSDVINTEFGNKVDMAFFKFCFADIKSKSDVNKIFDDYKQSMSKLENRYSETVFIHLTVPLLTRENKSFKNWIKKIFGKNDAYFANEHNIKRNEFNEMMRAEYEREETLFDVAKIESIKSDGTRETFTDGGKRYFALSSEYTSDGGHLNEAGRKLVAEQFLLFLLNLS